MWEVIHGDCRSVLPTLTGIDLVVTSPPYAMQRKAQYGGIPEAEYPDWTVGWMRALLPALTERASVMINIREHVKGGQMSDYVHRTRMALRADGWIECDEIVWIKKNAMPVGDPVRPRRSWERVLWFSRVPRPFCDATGNGSISTRTDGGGSQPAWCRKLPPAMNGRLCRHTDIAECALVPTQNAHPASFPVSLPAYLIRGWSKPGATVLDPFSGSGSTGVACIQTGRNYIGIEQNAEYCELARKRISEATEGK